MRGTLGGFPIDPAGCDGGTKGVNGLPHLAGCDQGVLGEEEGVGKSILVMCTYCANVYHPVCAGLPISTRRVRNNWACPECIFHAETQLQLEPLHAFPGPSMEITEPAGVTANEVDEVEPPDDGDEDSNVEPLADFHKLPWLRWCMAQQPDFQAEANVLIQLAIDRGYTMWFLPKFHCELNWIELAWGTMKQFTRAKIDGRWSTMVKALWWSYGEGNLPLGLLRSFTRKVRELVHLYQHDLQGPFAVYCQSKIRTRRLPFIDPAQLKAWAVGSLATCPKKEWGRKRVRCTIVALDEGAKTCTVDFGTTKRHKVPLEVLKPRQDRSSNSW